MSLQGLQHNLVLLLMHVQLREYILGSVRHNGFNQSRLID